MRVEVNFCYSDIKSEKGQPWNLLMWGKKSNN